MLTTRIVPAKLRVTPSPKGIIIIIQARGLGSCAPCRSFVILKYKPIDPNIKTSPKISIKVDTIKDKTAPYLDKCARSDFN
jgi:hypothetical protein